MELRDIKLGSIWRTNQQVYICHYDSELTPLGNKSEEFQVGELFIVYNIQTDKMGSDKNRYAMDIATLLSVSGKKYAIWCYRLFWNFDAID